MLDLKKDTHTKYIKDGNTPYIEIIHVKPHVEFKWYLDKSTVEKINSSDIMYLKEVHY